MHVSGVEQRPAGDVQNGTDLRLTASGSTAIVPGQNVTATFTLTNAGDAESTAPAVQLVNVPTGWEVVNHSSDANASWSAVNEAWISTRALAPGESVSVSVTLRLPNETARSEYYVSARATDAAGSSAVAAERFPVGFTESEALSVESSVAESTRPGQNVTVDLALRNTGRSDSTAPVLELTGVPTGWEVVNQSAGPNVTYNAERNAWISTRSLAPGESMEVSAVLRPSRESALGAYYVSILGSDADGEAAVTTATVDVAGEPVPEATPTPTATATETETEVQTTTADQTSTATTTEAAGLANVSATFVREGADDVTVTLEVADSPEERRRGLMFRESLPRNHGMVFVYESAEPRSFWMKNTLIPLDMVFVAPNGTVLNVEHASTQPNASDAELKRYRSAGDAQYVIELDRGFANRTGVGPGTQVVFDVPGQLEPTTTAE